MMARWNHFADEKFTKMSFKDVSIGEKFRLTKWKGKIARRDIVMIKTGETKYQEFKSKKKYESATDDFAVSSFNQPTPKI